MSSRHPGGAGLVALALVLGSSGPPPPARAAEIAFVEVAASLGLDFVGSEGTAFPELDVPEHEIMQRNMGNGAAVGDYDGDGDIDVYVLAQLGHPNRLFRNDLDQGAAGFSDVTPPALADTGLSRVAHFADLDRDGDLDLLLVNDDSGGEASLPSRLFRNDGAAGFADVTAGSGFRPLGYLHAGAALADYDGDGLLDVYVTNWGLRVGGLPAAFPGSNRLYRNRGDFVFEDVTASSGLDELADNSFSAIFSDFENDGRPDLWVALDNAPDRFLRNSAGHFSDASTEVGALHLGNDMGIACADFDDDDDLDLFLTNITDSSPIPEFGTGQFNAFHVNRLDSLGETRFEDEALARGVEDAYWGWGTQFVDVDNDGDLDLVAVTGFDEWIADQTLQPESSLLHTPTVLYVNDAGQFERVSGVGLDAPDDSRALVAFDYDRDGDQDLLVTNVGQPLRLLENRSGDSSHWLGVDLAGVPGAVGARVYATVGARTQRRDVIFGRSYLAGTPAELHFGLGDARRVDVLRIDWPDGSSEVFHDVEGDRWLRAPHFVPEPGAFGAGLACLLALAARVASRPRRSRARSRGRTRARLRA